MTPACPGQYFNIQFGRRMLDSSLSFMFHCPLFAASSVRLVQKIKQTQAQRERESGGRNRITNKKTNTKREME